MSKKFKIIIAMIIIGIIAGEIVSCLGKKFEQQKQLHLRVVLDQLDSKLRENGVNICLIQPRLRDRRNLLVMLDFWETDTPQVLKKLEIIEDTVYQYAQKADERIRGPVIKYLDEDGFNLEDTLEAKEEVALDVTQAEYYDVVQRFTNDLTEKIKQRFSKEIAPERFRVKLIADVKYDVTLDAYSPKKLFFFARFLSADTDQLQAVRIAYKKISGFKVARGDQIYFYNLEPEEYKIIEHLAAIMDSKVKKEISAQAVVFDPLSGLRLDTKIPTAKMKISPVSTGFSPAPSPAAAGETVSTPIPEETVGPSTPTPTPEETIAPSPYESTEVTPAVKPSATIQPSVTSSPTPQKIEPTSSHQEKTTPDNEPDKPSPPAADDKLG